MTGRELIDALKMTGTGEAKLNAAEVWLEKNPTAPAEKLLAEMERIDAGTRRSPWPEMTISKARQLIGGVSPASMLGIPPPHSKEAGEERLAKCLASEVNRIVEAVGVRQHEKQQDAQEQGIGAPRKPERVGR